MKLIRSAIRMPHKYEILIQIQQPALMKGILHWTSSIVVPTGSWKF